MPSEGNLWQATVLTADYANGSGILTRTACYLTGWSFYEWSGTGNSIALLHDGTDANGIVVATIGLPSNGSNCLALSPPWVPCPSGLYFDVHRNSPRGSVYVILRPGGLE